MILIFHNLARMKFLAALDCWYGVLIVNDEYTTRNLFVLDPARELFIWAVFAARLDTAEMFWRVSRTPLALALMAPALAKSCCSYLSADEKAIKKSFVEIERTFVKHSVNLLSKGIVLDIFDNVA